MQKIIIAGFPGVGKSEAGRRQPGTYIDLESSNYHWLISSDGEKHLHPEWPVNYIDAIKTILEHGLEDENDRALYICISTHKEVLNELYTEEIPFIAVVPNSKEIYLQRYKDRGNSAEFIEKLDSNFDQYIEDIKKSGATVLITTDSYILDVFGDNDVYWGFRDMLELMRFIRSSIKHHANSDSIISFSNQIIDKAEDKKNPIQEAYDTLYEVASSSDLDAITAAVRKALEIISDALA